VSFLLSGGFVRVLNNLLNYLASTVNTVTVTVWLPRTHTHLMFTVSNHYLHLNFRINYLQYYPLYTIVAPAKKEQKTKRSPQKKMKRKEKITNHLPCPQLTETQQYYPSNGSCRLLTVNIHTKSPAGLGSDWPVLPLRDFLLPRPARTCIATYYTIRMHLSSSFLK